MYEDSGKDCSSAARFFSTAKAAVTRCFIAPVKAYQTVISPLLPHSCRFTPTCSEYMIQALLKKGPVKGLVLGIWRILRCNPLCKGGYDPVKEKKSGKQGAP